MDSRLEDLFNKFASWESWRGKCVAKLREAVIDDGAQSRIVASLVGEDGARGIAQNNATWKPEQVWGVDINTCYAYCGRSKFPMVDISLTSLRCSAGSQRLTDLQGVQLPGILRARNELLTSVVGPNGAAAVRRRERES
jgi:hypothetical protein